jgi:signal transduction histidine kinase
MTALAHPTVAQLRPFDLFEGLTDIDLEDWTDVTTLHDAEAGDRLIEQNEAHTGVTLLLEGTLEMLALDGEVEARQGLQVGPTWLGAVPTLLTMPSPIGLRAVTPARYATIEPEAFLDLAFAHRAVFRRAMAQMKPMMARVARRQQQQERLEALGTMAAGLAHELNNPAAAAKQASRELTESLVILSETVEVFVESGVEREAAARLVALHAGAQQRCTARTPLSALAQSDREDELGDALSKLGVPEPWNMAATLASGGVDPAYVQEVAGTAGPLTVPVLRWIAASLAARQLASELASSTERMSDLVVAIKRYAYARPGQVDEVDVREGLETTLTLLGHKLKHTSITVTRDYDPTLGTVAVYSSELNQVWTNLLDNAIDALGESGEITITTRADGDCVEVDIADDGPGMTPDVLRRVFDPFYTTKDVGKGTGLGLDTARRIIVDRHHGSLTVESQPGATVFRARFTYDAARR